MTIKIILQYKDGGDIRFLVKRNPKDFDAYLSKPKKVSYLNYTFNLIDETYNITDSQLVLYYEEI